MKKKEFRGFNSLFMGGFECSDHINRSGKRINLLEETEHHLRTEQDYKLLIDVGIKVVREGVCWSIVEKEPYKFDFSSINKRLEAAEKFGIQIIWDLCHFGYPNDLVPTHPLFTDRFIAYCRAFAIFQGSRTKTPLLVVPINEISFLSWHSGDMRGTVPFAVNSGFDIKYHLCKAAIQGMKVLKQTNPYCKIFVVEPLVKIHSANDELKLYELDELNSHQFQAADIISGKMCPELEGSPHLFDMIGVNYYYNNQWDHMHHTLPWPSLDNKLTPLSQLLMTAYTRFQKPLVLSETGHFGDLRELWLKEITNECETAILMGVDLQGICIYPVIDRPDWDDLSSFSNCGIWDMDSNRNRVPHQPSVKLIRQFAEHFESSRFKNKVFASQNN